MDMITEAEVVSDFEDDRIKALIFAWLEWRRTRKFLAPPAEKSILAKLINPAGGGDPPDAAMDACANFFNLAYRGMPESKAKLAFEKYYLGDRVDGGKKKPVKQLASELGMTRESFHRALKDFRAKTYASYHRMVANATFESVSY